MIKKCLTTALLLCTTGFVFAQPHDGVDYKGTLKRGAFYSTDDNKQLPAFVYQSANDPVLVSLRRKRNLDSIAGFGNEASRVINLMHWVHNTVKHDGQHESGIKKINADEIITAAVTRQVGVSCGELATTLNDCYLAMGWKTRKVYCFPKDSLRNDYDSHVINMVYLLSLQKWIWVDATNDAYIMDEKGALLGIEEVRERLVNNLPLLVNPDANWNHRTSTEKEFYLDKYMAKNLYRFYSPLHSEYDYETWGRQKKVEYVYLNPLDYHKKTEFKTADYYHEGLQTTFVTYNIYNQKLFWQSPE